MRTLTQPLNMSPGGIPPVIHVSQYDSDFTIVFTLFSTVGDFTIESGTTAMVRGTKSSGTGYSADATINISAKTVTVTGNQQMTAAAGQNVFEITLLKSGKEISSKNFILLCERAALDADTITDESVLKELNAIIEGAETATQAAEEAEDAADRAEAAAQTFVIDSTPTQGSAHAVSSGGVYDALQSAGLSEDAKAALLACFEHVAWIDEHGQDYYDALASALYTETQEIAWINGYDSNNSKEANYHVAPFIYGPDYADYDYSRKICAIEGNFSMGGKLTIGVYKANIYNGKTFDIQDNWEPVTSIIVPGTGRQKIRFAPFKLNDGEYLTIGENTDMGGTDAAIWYYGGNGASKGFFASDYNAGKFSAVGSSLGFNVYSIRGVKDAEHI